MVKIVQLFSFGFCVALLPLFVPAAKADVPEHGRDCASAAQIGLNTEHPATLADSQDRAVYRIVLEKRGLFEVWTDPGNFDVGTTALLDSTCKAMQTVTGGPSFLTNSYSKIAVPNQNTDFTPNSAWTLAPGVYFIRFTADPVLVSGEPFIFHNRFIEHFGHDCSTAEPLAFPASVEGALLFSEDREVFRLTIPSDAQIHSWTSGSRSGPDAPSIELRLSDCSSGFELESDDETPAGIVTARLNAGTYYLFVEPNGSDSLGPFTLHVGLETNLRIQKDR